MTKKADAYRVQAMQRVDGPATAPQVTSVSSQHQLDTVLQHAGSNQLVIIDFYSLCACFGFE